MKNNILYYIGLLHVEFSIGESVYNVVKSYKHVFQIYEKTLNVYLMYFLLYPFAQKE